MQFPQKNTHTHTRKHKSTSTCIFFYTIVTHTNTHITIFQYEALFIFRIYNGIRLEIRSYVIRYNNNTRFALSLMRSCRFYYIGYTYCIISYSFVGVMLLLLFSSRYHVRIVLGSSQYSNTDTHIMPSIVCINK